MIRFFSVFNTSLVLLVLVAVGTASAKDKPKLIVGGDHDCPPYEFLENGIPTGFDIDLMRAVAEVMGFDLEIRLGPWSKARHDLEQGKIEALAGMYYSPERRMLVDFSVPHTMVSSGIFVRKDSPIRSFEDIRGKEIIVQESDVIHDFLKRHSLTTRIVAVTDAEEALKLLASGKYDCALMPSRLQGEYYVGKYGLTNLRVINTDLPQLQYCFAVRKGNQALLYRLDEGLNILRVTGRYRDIYEKWFGVYERRNLRKSLRYFVPALALIAALLAASLIWSRSLQRQVRIRTAELRESEEKFRVLAETSPAGIFLYQGERIIHINAAAARLLGYTERECLQLRFWDWAHDDFKEMMRDRGLARQRGEPLPLQYECKYVIRSGEERWAYISAGSIEFKGKPAGIVTMFDITDRKRLEDELRHAYDELEKRVEERTKELAEAVEMLQEREKAVRQLADDLDQKQTFLCTLIDAVPDLIFYKDHNSVYLGCNKAFEAFAGVSKKDMTGCTDLDIFPGEVAGFLREMDRKMLSNGESQRNEEWIAYPDGRRVLLETLKTPFYNRDGVVLGVVGISRDITERKRMEEELRESNEKYQAMIDAFDGLVYVCSADYRIEFMNKGFINRTGCSDTGGNCYTVLHGRDSVCPWCANEPAFESKTARWEYLNPNDGRWYYVVSVPFYRADGSISIQTMVMDITERKRVEELLRKQKQQLEELNSTLEKKVLKEVAKNREKDIVLIQQNRQAALGEMLDHIAHQWKQPLNSISLIVQDLREKWSDGELTDEGIEEVAGRTMALIEHMAQTIDVFRDFYRPGKEKKVFSIKDSIDQAMTFIAPALRFHSVVVELDVDPGLSAFGHPKEYAQVLLNILANARDAFKVRKTGKPRVMIRAFAEDNKTVVP
jgi:PAS domain S-box-containing protein